MKLHDRLSEIALKRSFLIPSAEIYGHISGFYDFGPVGCLMKRKIENAWRNFFLKRDGIHEIESSHILPEIVLKASGHTASFADPLTACRKCRNKFRADHILEEMLKKKCDGLSPSELSSLIKKHNAKCPQCGGELEGVGWFNLMFKTNIGPIEGNTAYARPETAQGIFLDFPRIFRNYGSKLPLAVAQIGRSYRNEISPRQGLLRLREFSQMEIEYFFNPSKQEHPNFPEVADKKIRILTREEQEKKTNLIKEYTAKEAVERKVIPNEIMGYFLVREREFFELLGIPYGKMYFRQMPEEETPHYSLGNFDLEVETSYGTIEIIGNAYRSDYDLRRHAEFSKQELSVYIEEEKKRIIPHVVEPSFGVDRLFWCILEHNYRPASAEKNWEWFAFPPLIAPYDAAVFPLVRKDGLPEKAEEILRMLRENNFYAYYSDNASIGRRYARADEIGTPYCFTVDYETLKDETCTVRYRDDGKQERVKISEIPENLTRWIREGKSSLENMQRGG